MTKKDRDQIEKDIDNPEKLDFFTAAIIEMTLDICCLEDAPELMSAINNASPQEANTFYKSLRVLHSTLSEIYEKTNGNTATAADEKAINKRYSYIYNLICAEETND